MHRPVHVSRDHSPLVLTFDPDRSYLQSVQKVVPMRRSGDPDRMLSVLLSHYLRPRVMNELRTVIEERQEAWMEVGTYPPVAELAVEWACHFIVSLPTQVTDPEVGAGPGGEVSFDWYDGRDHILSIGIHPDGAMNYAYASGNDRAHATRSLEKGLPASLLGMLESFKIEEHAYVLR